MASSSSSASAMNVIVLNDLPAPSPVICLLSDVIASDTVRVKNANAALGLVNARIELLEQTLGTLQRDGADINVLRETTHARIAELHYAIIQTQETFVGTARQIENAVQQARDTHATAVRRSEQLLQTTQDKIDSYHRLINDMSADIRVIRLDLIDAENAVRAANVVLDLHVAQYIS